MFVFNGGDAVHDMRGVAQERIIVLEQRLAPMFKFGDITKSAELLIIAEILSRIEKYMLTPFE